MPLFTNKHTNVSPVIVHAPGAKNDFLYDLIHYADAWNKSWYCPDDLTVFTINIPVEGWYDQWNKGKECGVFEESCRRAGIQHIVITEQNENYHNLKIGAYEQMLKLCKTPYMMYCDSSDVVLVDSPSIALHRFKEYGNRLVFQGENLPGWPPYPDIVMKDISKQRMNPCICAGCFIGETEFFGNIFKQIKNFSTASPADCDQAVIREVAKDWYPTITSDEKGEIFQDLAGLGTWGSLIDPLEVFAMPYTLVNLLKEIKKERIYGVEIGVEAGLTSRVLLSEVPELYLFMVDSWAPFQGDEKFESWTASDFAQARERARRLTDPYADRRYVCHASSERISQSTPNYSMDFIFIDACHQYESIAQDLELWEHKLAPRGIMCGHDYTYRSEIYGVKKAVDEFAHKRNLNVEFLSGDVWVLRR